MTKVHQINMEDIGTRLPEFPGEEPVIWCNTCTNLDRYGYIADLKALTTVTSSFG